MEKSGYYFVLNLMVLTICCKDLPQASFTHEAERYEVGYLIEFTSTSSKATAYDWNFGDGNSSSEMNPSHIYDQAGTYTVQLQVSNDDGSDASSEQLTIDKKNRIPDQDYHSQPRTGRESAWRFT